MELLIPKLERIVLQETAEDILTLLAVTDTYMKEFADINLQVISSS